jgi:hypothetical protein
MVLAHLQPVGDMMVQLVDVFHAVVEDMDGLRGGQ